MAKVAKRPKLLTTFLREDFARSTRPHKVDRDRGIIFEVKVVGLHSPNTHGVAGAQGTDYLPEALRSALPLYEGINVNVDHPPRKDPDQERSALTRFAWLEEARITGEGIFADLHFLDPADPLAVKMLNAAELKPDAFALSHNAIGKGEVRGGRYVVTEIPEVRSVDIVADGGTNRSLFESKGKKPMKTTLRKLIKESKALPPATRRRLLEMGSKYCTEEMDEERDVAADADMEAEEEPSWKDHVSNAVGSLVKSEDPGDHDKAGKLLKHLRPEEVEEAEEPADDPDPENPEELDDESQGGRRQGPEKKKGQENTASDEKGKENMESRQRRAKARCTLAGVTPTADLIESLAAVPSVRWDGLLLAVKQASQGRPSAPRSMGAGGIQVAEGRRNHETFDAKKYSERLLCD
jgi:hypothetical protein